MKITMVCTGYYPAVGGGETYFYELSKNLAKQGNDVTVLTSNYAGVTGYKIVEGVKVHYLPWPRLFGHPIPLSLYKKKFRKILNSSDIIHTCTITLPLGLLQHIFTLRSKLVITIHENIGKKWFYVEKNIFKALIFYLFEFFILSLPYKKIITVSIASKKDISKHPLISSKKIEVAYPGIDKVYHEKKTIKKPAQKYFLFYGRPGITKGVHNLVNAMNMITNDVKREDLKLIMILGPEPAEERLKILQYIEKHQLESIIEVKNSVDRDKLIEYIVNAEFVVIPSLTEGFGFTTVESCTLKKPVVISDAGSLPEVVFGKYIQTQRGDSHSLAEGLKRAINKDFDEKPQKTYDWENTTGHILNIYNYINN